MTVSQPPPEPSRYPDLFLFWLLSHFQFWSRTKSLLEAPSSVWVPLTANSTFADSLIGPCARRLPPGAASIERIACDAKLPCASPGQVQVLKVSVLLTTLRTMSAAAPMRFG